MKTRALQTSALAAIVLATTALAIAPVHAADVKQMGSQPNYDQLIKSLTPDPAQIGNGTSRGLRVLSGRTPGTEVSSNTGGSSGGGHAAPAPTQDSRAPAVALEVRFATGSDELTDSARDTLNRVSAALKSTQLSSFRFMVEGHTDSTGNPDANLALSTRRAEAVKTYLVSSAGIPAERLETAGKGSAEPIDAVHPESGVNRRVQIVNLGQ